MGIFRNIYETFVPSARESRLAKEAEAKRAAEEQRQAKAQADADARQQQAEQTTEESKQAAITALSPQDIINAYTSGKSIQVKSYGSHATKYGVYKDEEPTEFSFKPTLDDVKKGIEQLKQKGDAELNASFLRQSLDFFIDNYRESEDCVHRGAQVMDAFLNAGADPSLPSGSTVDYGNQRTKSGCLFVDCLYSSINRVAGHAAGQWEKGKNARLDILNKMVLSPKFNCRFGLGAGLDGTNTSDVFSCLYFLDKQAKEAHLTDKTEYAYDSTMEHTQAIPAYNNQAQEIGKNFLRRLIDDGAYAQVFGANGLYESGNLRLADDESIEAYKFTQALHEQVMQEPNMETKIPNSINREHKRRDGERGHIVDALNRSRHLEAHDRSINESDKYYLSSDVRNKSREHYKEELAKNREAYTKKIQELRSSSK